MFDRPRQSHTAAVLAGFARIKPILSQSSTFLSQPAPPHARTDPVTPADWQQYRAFVESQIQTLGKPPPTPLWHYSRGETLIKIIESGKLFSTQVPSGVWLELKVA